MKKVIWIFGESATGKETLVNSLYNQNSEILNMFNLNNQRITYSKITIVDHDNEDYGEAIDDNIYDDSLMDQDNEYFSQAKAKRRRSCIMSDIKRFISDDNDVLLIKGQINDLRVNRGNIVDYYLKQYGDNPNIKTEVIILKVDDYNELRRRLECKSWFRKLTNEKEKQRLLEKTPINQQNHIEEVINSFKDYEIPVLVYESLEHSYRLDSEKGKIL